MRLRSGFVAIALSLSLVTVGGCRDDDESTAGTHNSPPTINGAPKTEARAGERYEFTPSASDPEGQTLQFAVANRPEWSTFDATNGSLAGTPTADHVGTFTNVTISVTEREVTQSLPPFAIKVEAAESTSGPPAPPMPSAGGPFRFSEIPEIVFVRGYRESEQLAIFHIDTLNRWRPGDLDNESGWRPRIATELVYVTGSLVGVSYDTTTGLLTYDGSGSGTETARVKLTAPTQDAVSEEFNVRVLQPTIAWGVDAAHRFPGIGIDSESVSWQDMRRRLRPAAPYAEPNVLVVTPGQYSGNFYIQRELLNLYILGEPGSRPVLVGDELILDGLETAYLKNLELDGTTVHTSVNLRDHDSNVYVTRIHQHDSTGDGNGFKASPGQPDANISWRYWFWNFRGSQMGWQSNLRHQMYIEGRLDSRLLINNVRITGTKECSAVKATRPFISIRNSYLSAVLDEGDLAAGMRADKLIDLANVAEVVIYNNELVGAYTPERWGVSDGLIFLRAHRGMWAGDSPVYPDVSWDPPTSSIRPGFAPPGFTAGPETFVNPAFWEAVRSYDVADPANPYSFKKYVAYNRFRWLAENDRRQAVFRDDGTAPRTNLDGKEAPEIWGTVPPNWSERSVTFFANNRYEGWLPQDMTDPHRWFELDNHAAPSLVTFNGPGPWAYPPPPRPVVFVG
ncbi:MAG: hypothetical protein EHM89_10360, partial [Acidobacteria bacterium]